MKRKIKAVRIKKNNFRRSVNFMKERILLVGVGQAGANIVKGFESKGYLAMYVNTSSHDLSLIDSPYKVHIPGAVGCNKDRQKAINYTVGHYDKIKSMIDSRFSSQDFVFFVFSAGGGTGSGISPIALDVLSNEYTDKDGNETKKFGAMCVLPSIKDESVQEYANGVVAYKELREIELLKNVYLLDNNNAKDKFSINKRFVDLFDRLITVTQADEKGNIDEAELELMLSEKGCVYLSDLQSALKEGGPYHHSGGIQNMDAISNSKKESIFASLKKGCKYVALSINSDINLSRIKEEFGEPVSVFRGHNKDTNFFAVFGMEIETDRVKQIKDAYDAGVSNIGKKENSEGEVDLTIAPLFGSEETKEKKPKKDIKSLFEKYTG